MKETEERFDSALLFSLSSSLPLSPSLSLSLPPPLTRAHTLRCRTLFNCRAADDTQIDVKVPDYTPAVLGSDFATAGTIVGARMEQLAATARQLGSDPSAGYAVAHVHDPDWWKDANAGPG